MTSISLPYPPSLWKLYTGHGRSRRKSSQYKQWLTAAGWELQIQRPKRHSGKIAVTIFATRPDNRRRDLENICKAICDLLVAHQVIKDDSLIGVLHCSWRDDGKGVTVVVDDLPQSVH